MPETGTALTYVPPPPPNAERGEGLPILRPVLMVLKTTARATSNKRQTFQVQTHEAELHNKFPLGETGCPENIKEYSHSLKTSKSTATHAKKSTDTYTLDHKHASVVRCTHVNMTLSLQTLVPGTLLQSLQAMATTPIDNSWPPSTDQAVMQMLDRHREDNS
jgi:hypothetical protein